jgi:hypothetical protein
MIPDFGEATFICGSAATTVPVIWVYAVAGAAGIVTVGCIMAALKMLLQPGETAPDHPKRRILAADR